MLRFSKPGHLRLTQGDMFTSKYGGSEANVAVSVATQGEEVTYITRLPDTPVGHAGAMNLAQLGVDTSHVLYGGQRIGTYYFEPPAGMRAAKVIYDRSGSAYYDLKPGMSPWREILKDCAYFHVSGITAAISQQAAEATFEALDIADELGVTVCFDINYRKNLWNYEGAEPRKTLSRMLSRCDMMFGDAIEFDWLSQHPQPPFTATDSNFQMQMKEYGESRSVSMLCPQLEYMTSLQCGRHSAVRVISAGVLIGSSVPPRISTGIRMDFSASRSFSSEPRAISGRP